MANYGKCVLGFFPYVFQILRSRTFDEVLRTTVLLTPPLSTKVVHLPLYMKKSFYGMEPTSYFTEHYAKSSLQFSQTLLNF